MHMAAGWCAPQEEVVAFGSDESGGQGLQSPDSVTDWFLVREAGLLTSLEVGHPKDMFFPALA